MIDKIVLSPVVHIVVGSLVLLAAVVAMLVTGRAALKREGANKGVKKSMIALQIALMIQGAVGIKLLDQGLGPLQLYIHYIGGLAPLAFCVATYWFRSPSEVTQTRRSAVAALASFVFVLMTFAIGSMYVPGGI